MSGVARPRAASRGRAAHRAARPRRGLPPGALRDATAAALFVLAVVALAAAVTAIGFAAPARDALGFGFGGLPRDGGEVVAVFIHNARLAGVVAGAVIVVQAPRLERDDGTLGATGRGLRTAVDVVLAIAVAANAAVVGIAFGAYGARMVSATATHGPVELAGYAAALALYLRARVRLLRPRPALTLAATALGLLALAALLEVYAQL